MELTCHGAYQLMKPALDGRVDVFIGQPDLEIFGLELRHDLAQPGLQRSTLISGQEAGALECRGIRDRAAEIRSPHPPIKADRGIEALHERVHRPGLALGEATTPEFHRLVLRCDSRH